MSVPTKAPTDKGMELAKEWLADNSYGYETTQEKKDSLAALLTPIQAEARERALEEAAQHLPEIQWDRDGDLYSAGCACGERFSIGLGQATPEDNCDYTWKIEWQQHVRALAQAHTPGEKEGI